ncbi:MAG: hypothetical protein ACJ74J_18615 [Blastocatellia bacterium]
MLKKRVYDIGHCRQCGKLFIKKPAQKEFCKRLCKDQYHNTTRGRVTVEVALEWIEHHLVTIRQAVEMGVATDARIRAMVRKKALMSRRLFGRILLKRTDIERLVK